jgi:hypothetical protein
VAGQGVSSLDRVEAIIRNPALYDLAKLVPQRQEGDVGRPREWPDFMLLLFESLISVYGSARKVEAELSHRHVWRFVQRLIKKVHKNDSSMWLPNRRYKRHHYMYGRSKYLADPAVLAQLQALHTKLAVEQANELGLLDENGDGTFTHPSLERLLYSDGKVVTPLYRARPGDTKVDRKTGEIRQLRYEADAGLHMQGDGEMAFGTKFVMTAVRSTDVHGRIIVDTRWCPVVGGEAKTAMGAFNDIAKVAPGAQGVVYDTALRGVHHQELMRDLGWLSINRVQAALVAKNKDSKPVRRVEKATHIEDKTIDGKTVRLFAQGGALCVADIDHNGDQVLTPLRRLRTIRRADKRGTFRWYIECALPKGGAVMVRLDTTDDDRARKLNRSENLRQIPPGDPDFKKLYKRRNDAESINRALDDSMWLGRAHSRGAARQSVNLLGYALSVNSLALYLHRQRVAAGNEGNSPPGEAAA